jgi:hypothetical protein
MTGLVVVVVVVFRLVFVPRLGKRRFIGYSSRAGTGAVIAVKA